MQSQDKGCRGLLGAYRGGVWGGVGGKVTANLKGTRVIYPYVLE